MNPIKSISMHICIDRMHTPHTCMHTAGSVTELIDQTNSLRPRGDDHSQVALHLSFPLFIICPQYLDHLETWRKHLSVLRAANLKVHPTVPESDFTNFWQLGNNPGVKKFDKTDVLIHTWTISSFSKVQWLIKIALPVSSTTFWHDKDVTVQLYATLQQFITMHAMLRFPLCCNIYWNIYCYTPDILCYSGIWWWESREPPVIPAALMLWLKTRSCTQYDC